jgi:tRNA A37 methylthiotransferase MiaB
MKLVMDAFGEKNIELTAMNGVSFASLDGEVLELMKRAGFHTINLSYVSSNPSTKERMRRPQERTDFNQILKKAEGVGLKVIAYAILGMPDQTIEEMVDTLIYLMGKKVLVGPSIYYPVPGTPLFQRCKEDGILPSNISQWRSSALPIETKEFNRLDMVTLLRLARVINVVKGKMDKGELEEGITWRELFQGLKDKVKAEAEVEVEDGVTLWADLLLVLFEERSFFSLRKIPGNGFSKEKEKTSRKVLDYFLEKAWEKPILRSWDD